MLPLKHKKVCLTKIIIFKIYITLRALKSFIFNLHVVVLIISLLAIMLFDFYFKNNL
jgi:hypothetical protein